MTGVTVLCLLGFAVAVAAPAGSKKAERRARARYRELMGEMGDDYEVPDDEWRGIRPVAGGWGCLSAMFKLVRDVSLVMALATALYLILA